MVTAEGRQYGASEQRLQARASRDQQIDLSGKWLMAGREPDPADPFGSGSLHALPAMNDWEWHKVSVPGSIRSGLLEAGVIDDPCWSDNEGKSAWTETKEWWFRKSVQVPEEWAGRRVFVGFDGVDYYSSVWFNGAFLGDHEGMYGGPVLDVSPLVRPGEANEIVVKIHPGGTAEPGRAFKGYIFMKWHYQTAISPRGIWRGARLVAVDAERLENPFVRTLSVSDDGAAELEISVDVHNSGHTTQTVIQATIAGENFDARERRFSLPVALPEGDHTVSHPVLIPDARLWWPAGMGDPNLYRLTLDAGLDGQTSDSISTTFGIRTLVFEGNPGLEPDYWQKRYQDGRLRPESEPGPQMDPSANSRFMCRINGKLISLRGAGGFGCHDQIYRFHDRKDAWFIKAALAMNFNFLRLHGAGLIATDEFYDLCDRMGMLVWQEFMVSNMGLSGLHYDVWRTQTAQSVLRLRNHPSLFYWCGGNEFNPDNTADETKKIIDMFDESVRKYDGTRPFSRAAQYVHDPHYNDQSGTYGGLKVAACTEYGGAYAGVVIGQRSLCKFLAEEDAVRWPPVTKDELDKVLPPDVLAGWDNSRRGAFVCHTALTGRLAGWKGDLELILPQSILFGIPRTMQEAIDTTQMCGGYTNACNVEAFRSRWPHPSLYASWDYAPIWPMSVTWGPVDYYGVVQPLGYFLKRAQEPLHVLMQIDPREHINQPMVMDAFPKIFEPGEPFKGRVYVASDMDHPTGKHTAEVRLFDTCFKLLHEQNMNLAGMKGGPTFAFLGSVTWEIPASLPNQAALVCVSLKADDGALVSRSVYPFWISSDRASLVRDVTARRDRCPRLTEMRNSTTTLRLTSTSEKVSFSDKDYLPSGTEHCAKVLLRVENKGDRPAFHTGIEIANADCRYLCDDNYFTLMPGETKQVAITIDPTTMPFYEYVHDDLVQPVGRELMFEATAWNSDPERIVLRVDDR